jgi:hypothetical protein
MPPRGRLHSKLGGVWKKYNVQIEGKSYSDYCDTLKEARDIAIDGVTRLGARSAHISKMSSKTRKGWQGTRVPEYDDFERYHVAYGKVVVKKGKF